jgi:tRNA(Ile)-lysidine synthase
MADDLPLTVDEARDLVLTALPDWAQGQPMAVACSGGPDSLALTLLASDAFPGQVTALIVDHGLRPESAAESTMVSRWLQAKNVPCEILTWTGNKPTSGVQLAARTARYRLLADACDRLRIGELLLAHHLDDQAETFLLAIGRKAGLQGLAGMAPFRNQAELNYVRPLLSIRKARLVATLEAMGQPFLHDPSNENVRFDRARLRQQMQALDEVGLSADLLAGSATRLADARDLMQDLEHDVRRLVAPHAPGLSIPLTALAPFLTSLPGQRMIIVPVLANMIDRVSGAKPRFDELFRLTGWVALVEPGTRTLGRCRIRLTATDLVILPEGGTA